MITALVVGAQLSGPLDLERAIKLRAGEVVRYYQRGGRTRSGIFQVLVVATANKVYVKAHDFSASMALASEDRTRLNDALRTSDPRALWLKRRTPPGFPSMADGIDVFLSYKNPSPEESSPGTTSPMRYPSSPC